MPLDAQTQLVALLGYPVEHSLSPLIHNTAFQEQELNWAYLATAVAPDDVREAVEGLKALRFKGANVTIPHKQTVLPLMAELSPQAEAVGAVNTIVCRRPSEEEPAVLFGDNTDIAGFLKPLSSHAEDVEGTSMLIFGAGGAARAVAYALLSAYRPQRLTLAARTPSKAERLARDLASYDERGALQVVPFAEAGPAVRSSRLLVNATPLGMYPHMEASPWANDSDFSAGQVAYDLVYNPERTRFLKEASDRGAMAISGLHMLVSQAAASYLQWTGQAMPTGTVKNALRRHRSQV